MGVPAYRARQGQPQELLRLQPRIRRGVTGATTEYCSNHFYPTKIPRLRKEAGIFSFQRR